MKKLLSVLAVLALSAISFAADEMPADASKKPAAEANAEAKPAN